MFNNMNLLIKLLVLLFRESIYLDKDNNSNDLARKVLKNIKTDTKFNIKGGDTEIVSNLKSLVSRMIKGQSPDLYNKSLLISSVSSILKRDRAEVFTSFENLLSEDLGEKETVGQVDTLRSTINIFLRDKAIEALVKRLHYNTMMTKDKDSSIADLFSEATAEFEKVLVKNAFSDPAVSDELDFSDTKGMSEMVKKTIETAKGVRKFKTAFKGFNRLTQGGYGSGETTVISALQHNYKSGFVVSTFLQILDNNKPELKDPKKKPLMLFFSLEDNIDIMIKFAFKYYYYLEHGELPKFENHTVEEIIKYVKGKAEENGFTVKIIRANPTDWSYKQLLSKLARYETDGFEIMALVIDYLSMIPTVGCNTTGPMGTDLRDLLRRIRNWCGVKDVAFITPHQLSTQAKELIKNGITDVEFTREVANKGYHSGSKQLDQEMDLEIYIHVCKIKGKYYLSIARGKHRGADIIPDKDKHVLLPFPEGAPIMPDLHLEEESTYDPAKDLDGFDFD